MNIESNKFISDKKLNELKRTKLNKVINTTNSIKNRKFLSVSKYKPYSEVFDMICKKEKITLDDSEFVYFLDFSYMFDATRGYKFENLTIDYSKILDSGLNGLKYKESECDNKFAKDYNSVIDSLILLSQRIIKKLKIKKCKGYKEKIIYFENIINKPASSFKDAIQRILFINQMLWQTTHLLNGLGDLDSKLIKYYENDIKKKIINEEDALTIIKNFYNTLHRYYWYKSNVLLGDTGQVIVLGKTLESGKYYYNELTYLFIKALKSLGLPDPKVVLRVSNAMPQDLLEEALKCIATGIGAPLFANDEVVIPALVQFGVDKVDACSYTTSACWEPLIGGKSSSLNNQTCLNYMRALDNLLKRENLDKINNFEELLSKYFSYLEKNINSIKRVLVRNRLQYDPLLSIFVDDCKNKKVDISAGGARYHNVGITSVGLSNTVNALINIKKMVFDNKELKLVDIKEMILTNFEGKEEYKKLLRINELKYGSDNKEIIELVNRITEETTKNTSNFEYYLGGKLKFGLSAPSYIDAARGFTASFDGRSKGEPFNVHISNDSINGFTEVVNFAGGLSYAGNRFNGNVVDIMMAPNFINDNFDKVISFLKSAIKVGFFEMQINVISSDILIEAKKNPDKFPNLVVRVWGFSSYFNDLPEEYKDVLIERALKTEGKI